MEGSTTWLDSVEPFELLENNDLVLRDRSMEEKVPFGERRAIDCNQNRALKLRPIVHPPRIEAEKSVKLEESEIVKENLVMMLRLKDMRRRMMQVEREMAPCSPDAAPLTPSICRPLNGFVLQSSALVPDRHLPPGRVITRNQARTLMKEVCALTAIHSGFDSLGKQEVDILTDIGIEFISRLGQSIRQECDRHFSVLETSVSDSIPLPRIEEIAEEKQTHKVVVQEAAAATAPVKPKKSKKSLQQKVGMKLSSESKGSSSHRTNNSVKRGKTGAKQSVSNINLAVCSALRKRGCDLSSLETHLSKMIRFGDHLRALDRKMLKKTSKATAAAASDQAVTPRPKRRDELNMAMKQALDSGKLGMGYLYETFEYNDTPVGIPERIPYAFRSKASLASASKSAALSKKNAAKKRKVSDVESAFSDFEIDNLQNGGGIKIEQLDLALAASSDPNGIGLGAELDLSNLDDLFDGDTMLGDDLLPTTF